MLPAGIHHQSFVACRRCCQHKSKEILEVAYRAIYSPRSNCPGPLEFLAVGSYKTKKRIFFLWTNGASRVKATSVVQASLLSQCVCIRPHHLGETGLLFCPDGDTLGVSVHYSSLYQGLIISKEIKVQNGILPLSVCVYSVSSVW